MRFLKLFLLAILHVALLSACGGDNNDENQTAVLDSDNDSILDNQDNCPLIANADQDDDDNDGLGNVCDNFTDADKDGLKDSQDNCPLIINANQADDDNDGIGNVCDNLTDSDNDGIEDSQDNCPAVANANQTDSNEDGIGDACSDSLLPLVTLFEDDFESQTLDKWSTFDLGGSNDWEPRTFDGNGYAQGNCYQSTGDCDDWIVSPQINLTGIESPKLTFTSMYSFGTAPLNQIHLKVSTDFDGVDPSAATWIELSNLAAWSTGDYAPVESGDISLSDYAQQPIHIAFHYDGPVATATLWQVDNVLVVGNGASLPLAADLNSPTSDIFTDREVSYSANASNGSGEYSYLWDVGFGDDASLTESEVSVSYDTAGQYNVTVKVTDSEGAEITQTKVIDVLPETTYAVPEKAGDLRIATFNIAHDVVRSANASDSDLTIKEFLELGAANQAEKVAEIVQHVNPDVLLINEIDGNDEGATLAALLDNYFETSQNNRDAVTYDHVFMGDCNTGVLSGQDLNNDGNVSLPDDGFGFGNYEGQYCMAVLSKYPLDTDAAVTLQNFLWKDMPDANEPVNADSSNYYSTDAWNVFRLSSKTHIDIPVNVGGNIFHVLGSHPTPPVFDGDEDHNGKRNFDEIRMWADYIDPNAGAYLYDDNNAAAGLAEETRFVILGDQNASLVEGDSYTNEQGITAIEQLLASDYVNPTLSENLDDNAIPMSLAGADNASESVYGKYHTASWQSRADYVLPSNYGFAIEQSGVYWPQNSDEVYYLVNSLGEGDYTSSDHRLVWMDLSFTNELAVPPSTSTVTTLVEEDFSSLDNVIVVDNGEPDVNWQTESFGEDTFAAINCYGNDETCDDWIIVAADLSSVTTATVTFDSAYNYGPSNHENIALKVATDFNGSDVNAATWSDLSSSVNWSPGSWAFVESGAIDLSSYAGSSVYIAVQYLADPNAAEGISKWEIDNLLVTGE